MNYRFFTNKNCEYYPCHKNKDGSPMEDINCLFCYCPLYLLDCPGDYTITSMGVKDCSNCILPHIMENYDTILNIFSNKFLMTQIPECDDPECSSNNNLSSYMCRNCVDNMVKSMSNEELYEIYVSALDVLKENPELIDKYVKALPKDTTFDDLSKKSVPEQIEVVTNFWFESINSILLEREPA